ncbi:MAG: ABC transporter permease [Halobacterium sp.]
MSWLTYAARRTAFAAVAAFLVVTLTFLVVKTAPNTDLGGLIASMHRAGASQAEIEAAVREYKRQHNLRGSLFEQYVRFVGDLLAFELGYSTAFRAPVGDLLGRALPRTLGYIVPGVLIAYAVGVLGGLVSAFRGRVGDWTMRVGSYVVLGATTIVVANLVEDYLGHYFGEFVTGWRSHPFISYGEPAMYGTEPWRSLGPKYVLPSLVVATALIAGLLRHTRNNALSYRGSATSKMLSAKGAGDVTSARHALRNAALPLLSVSFAELMSVLALGSFVVEAIFHIPGIAAYTMVGVYTRDYPLVMGATIVFAFIGIAGSLLQDLLYGYLDPRVGE